MRQNYLLPFILLFCLNVFGQAGFFGSNAGGVILLSHNAGTDFATRTWDDNLGSTHSLWLKGASAHTFKGSNGNICSATLHYRVYRQDLTPGAFSSFSLPSSQDHSFSTTTTTGSITSSNVGDQRWRDYTQNINIAALATSNGTWVLEVYFSATGNDSGSSGCGNDFFHSDGGNNFRIFFNMVDHYGDFASAVNLQTCDFATEPYRFYNTYISGDPINQIGTVNFDGQNLGSFFQNSGDFRLRGAEVKTFRENYANVCEPILRYRVYEASATPSGTFSSLPITFFEGCSGCPNGSFTAGDPCNGLGTCNDQKWQTIAANIDLTDFAPGSYVLEVYFDLPGSNSTTTLCTDNRVINNGGNNFKANFTIIPPTTSITTNP